MDRLGLALLTVVKALAPEKAVARRASESFMVMVRGIGCLLEKCVDGLRFDPAFDPKKSYVERYSTGSSVDLQKIFLSI